MVFATSTGLILLLPRRFSMGCGASSAKYDKKIVPVPDDDIIDDNVADRDDGTGRLQSACTEVRVFWDVENMMPPTDQIKHVKNMLCEKVQEVKPGAKVTIVALMDTGEPSLQGQKPELTAAGVDVQCTRFNPMKEKEASDKAIIMHSLLWLHDNKGNDVAVMFVTADTDFTVLINKIRGYNIDVFLVTRMTDSARDLREAATQPVVDWQTLLRQAGPGPATTVVHSFRQHRQPFWETRSRPKAHPRRDRHANPIQQRKGGSQNVVVSCCVFR